MTSQICQRQATESDFELIYHILRVSLGPYVEQTWGVWDDVAQRKQFEEVTKVEDHHILELNGKSAGCLCLLELETELRLVRLFIMPQFQNRGFGTQIMKTILMRSNQTNLHIRLRVLRVNPARKFYERLGFRVTEENESHYTMIRLPNEPVHSTPYSRSAPSGRE